MKEWEEIKVNKRSNDGKIYFESPLIQSISDSMDFLRDTSKEILAELDSNDFKQNIDEFDLDEFGKDTLNQIDDIIDDVSKFKSEIIDSDEFPDIVKKSSKNVKMALNRDDDYLRRAERKLNNLPSDELLNIKVNLRVIELCDKAIRVNYENHKAYYLKALAMTNLDKYDEAIDEFVKSLALNEDNLDAWLGIAKAYALDEKYSDAIEVYDLILKRKEDSYDALVGKAQAYSDTGNYEKADYFFKKADSVK